MCYENLLSFYYKTSQSKKLFYIPRGYNLASLWNIRVHVSRCMNKNDIRKFQWILIYDYDLIQCVIRHVT